MTGMPATSTSLGWSLPAVAILAAVAIAVAGHSAGLVPVLYLAIVTPVLFATDVVERRLPNDLVLPGYLVALAACGASWWATGAFPAVELIAGAVFFVVLLVMALAGGMGMGDVKLAGVLGISAALVGPVAAFAVPIVAFTLGGVSAIVALRTGSRAGIPFGPHLLAGYWVALVGSCALGE